VAVVTGGSRVIGRGIAEGLAEAGACVYVTDCSVDTGSDTDALTIQATARQVDQLGGRGVPVRLDPHDDDAVAQLFAQIDKTEGRLDLLVNGAYQIPDPDTWGSGFWEAPLSLWDQQCQTGLRSAYVAAAAAARLMVPARRGLIINISSRGASEYMLNTAYGVVKAGVDRMARDMAHELAAHGVSVLALWPGLISTQAVLPALAAGRLEADSDKAHSPRFIGRCVAALAMDPDIAEKTGGSFQVAELAREYRFREPEPDPQPVPAAGFMNCD